ncbi:MAG: PfkB family carbohydrate kinase, partial [Candidatus Promineifilaceae bacterium]
MNHTPHIVVVGSLNMDLVVEVPVIPRPGETVLGKNFATFPGGKGANQAVAAARLGARVSMIGRVGKDAFGDQLLASARADGIDVTRVGRDEKAASGVAMIAVDAQGQNSIAVASGANFRLTAEHVRRAWA